MMKIKFTLRYMAAMAACLAVTAMFASCTKNSNAFSNSDVSVIKAEYIEGFENITQIKAYVAETQWSKHCITEAFLKDNGFELCLPSVLSANYIRPVVNETMQGISISDLSAKWTHLGLEVESKSLYYILVLDNSHCLPDGTATKEVVYIYADRPVKLSGNNVRWEDNPRQPWSSLLYPYKVEITTIYSNLILVAGWNMVCLEKSLETISSDLRKVYFTYSNKDISDCEWKFIIHDFSGY